MTHNDTSEEQILEAAIEEWARRKRDDSQKMTNAQAAAMLKEMLGTPGGARKITLTVFLASTVVLLTAVGAFVGHKAMRPAPSGPVATAQAQLEFVDLPGGPLMDASATTIDPGNVRQLLLRCTDLDSPSRPARDIELYSSEAPRPEPSGRSVSLASLDCPGAKPVPLRPLDAAFARYEIELAATAFDAAVRPAIARWYAQPNFGQMQLRTKRWPIWVEGPRRGQVLDSPFVVKGQAYEDGFINIRVKPKLWNLFYGEKVHPVRAGQRFGPISIREGGAEGYELYVLFARRKEDLPVANPVESLPYATGRIDILGPVDIFVRPKRGPVRSEAELRAELELSRTVAASLTKPDQQSKTTPQVTWEYRCAGRVSDQAAKLNLQYVLAVRHGHHVWFQSSPWAMEGRDFSGKPVRFGVQHETAPEVHFEIWLIAVKPAPKVAVEEGQAWPAACLPANCVRVASVAVVKKTPLSRPSR